MRAIPVFLADLCKQELCIFHMDVAIENEVVKVPGEGKYTQSSVVAAASALWEN